MISARIGDGDKLSCPPESVNFTDTTAASGTELCEVHSSYTVQAKPVSMVSARKKTLLGSSDIECFFAGRPGSSLYLITLATIRQQFTEGM